jgi:hypothetical protein
MSKPNCLNLACTMDDFQQGTQHASAIFPPQMGVDEIMPCLARVRRLLGSIAPRLDQDRPSVHSQSNPKMFVY